MKKQVRFGFLALALAVTFGSSSLVDRDATAAMCWSVCVLTLENCYEGITYPECQGDGTCCLNATSACFNHATGDC